MPVVELSRSRLARLVGRPGRQVVESLPFLGLDIESEDGDTLRVEYSPNRPDYSTDVGIALGMQGLLGKKTGMVRLRVKESARYSIRAESGVSRVRPYVTGIAAKGGRIDNSMIRQLMSMQEDLHFGIGRRRKKSSIGIHDLDRIEFPLRYRVVGRDHEFVPLNDTRALSISEILESTDVGRDYGGLLGGSSKVPIIMDSAGNTVSLPPIINADTTTVTTKTRNLFVEVTGISKPGVEDMLAVVAVILSGYGFSLESVRVSGSGNSTPGLGTRRMRISPVLVNDTLGLNLSDSRIVSCLRRSRLDAVIKKKEIECIIPPYRFDIFGPMDLVEEAALGYGIANLLPELPASGIIGEMHASSQALRKVGRVMTGLGYMEALNSSLASGRILYDMTDRKKQGAVSVTDSKSQEHTILRDSIVPGLLENLSRNVHESYPQRLYETGSVFWEEDPVSEGTRLGAVLAHKDADYAEIKSVLQSALDIGFEIKVRTRTASRPPFAAGRCASVLVGGRSIGMIGEIDSGVVENCKIRVPVAAFEVSLDAVLEPGQK